MPVRTARKARDDHAAFGRRVGAFCRAQDGLLAVDDHDNAGSLAGRDGCRAPRWLVVRAASAGADDVSVAAVCGAGAGDPRGAREDQLGADAARLALRPAPLDLLQGASSSWRLAAAPHATGRLDAPLRMDRGWRALAHRRLLAAAL